MEKVEKTSGFGWGKGFGTLRVWLSSICSDRWLLNLFIPTPTGSLSASLLPLTLLFLWILWAWSSKTLGEKHQKNLNQVRPITQCPLYGFDSQEWKKESSIPSGLGARIGLDGILAFVAKTPVFSFPSSLLLLKNLSCKHQIPAEVIFPTSIQTRVKRSTEISICPQKRGLTSSKSAHSALPFHKEPKTNLKYPPLTVVQWGQRLSEREREREILSLDESRIVHIIVRSC